MAQNTVEDIKSAIDKTEVSETSPHTIDKADSGDDKENANGAMDSTNAKPIVEENKESDKKDKVEDNSTDTLDSKEQSNAQETGLVENPKKEAESEKETSSEKTIKTKTKENELGAECSAETTNNADEQVNAFCAEAEEQLNEILKVVQEDLDMEYFQKSPSQSVSAKDDAGNTSGDKQQTIKVESVEKQDTVEDAIAQDAEEKKDLKESPEKDLGKSEEKPEVGIVGPPTAVSELIKEELIKDEGIFTRSGGDSSDQKDHVAEWVEKSAKEDTSTNADDEDIIADEQKHRTNGSEIGTKRKNEDAMSISPRKSQKIVSNIIKKSIKW